MKKLFSIVLMLIFGCSLVACGCEAQTTAPTTVPATKAPTTIVTTAPTTSTITPTTDPTIESNIPDPEVMPGTTDVIESTFDNSIMEDVNPEDDTVIENTYDTESSTRTHR